MFALDVWLSSALKWISLSFHICSYLQEWLYSQHCIAMHCRNMIERQKGRFALQQTAEDFAERTSIHGIGYVFDRSLYILDRSLWSVVVLAFLGIAMTLTWNTWTQWQNEQVVFVKTNKLAKLRRRASWVGFGSKMFGPN